MQFISWLLSFITMAQQPYLAKASSLLSHDHTLTHHTRQDSSGRVISPSQKPLPDKTQQSRQTSMPPAGFESTISASERLKTYALYRKTTGIGQLYSQCVLMLRVTTFNQLQTVNIAFVTVYCAGWHCAHRVSHHSVSGRPHRQPNTIRNSSANPLHCGIWYTDRTYGDVS